MITVLVVDDSLFMRKIVGDIINAEKDMKVCGQAENGVEALELIPMLKPNLVVLDLEMPIMGGLETLINIMKRFPLPVLVLSGYESKLANASIIAIELGAIDFIPKPGGSNNLQLEHIKTILIEKIRIAVKAKTFKENIELSIAFKGYKKNPEIHAITAITASTGGVRALSRLIPFLPLNYPSPILITQHMPAGFTKNFSKRLNSISKIEVKEAEDGELLYNGIAYIAPGDYHLRVDQRRKLQSNRFRIKLTKNPKELGVRPSANKMFESIAPLFKERIIAVILTGMGRDGLRGAKEIKNQGGMIISEHKSSCVIYGMPKAVEPISDRVLPLNLISGELNKSIRKILKEKCPENELDPLKLIV